MIGQNLASVTELATPVAITPIFINAFVVSGWLFELGWGDKNLAASVVSYPALTFFLKKVRSVLALYFQKMDS